MTTRRERLRWRLAYLLNRVPWVCWADLVSWVMQTHPALSRSLLECGSRSCREEARTHRDRACYCGKFRQPADTLTSRKDVSA
jgi:hypothetical protein